MTAIIIPTAMTKHGMLDNMMFSGLKHDYTSSEQAIPVSKQMHNCVVSDTIRSPNCHAGRTGIH